MTPSSTRVGVYVTVCSAIVSGRSGSVSSIPIRRPPRVTTRRSIASSGAPAAISASASARTASASNGRRSVAALRAMRSRCSSIPNGRPA